MSATWSFGLKDHAGLYLTAEPFNFGLFSNGKNMKRKQIFFLEQQNSDVFFKTYATWMIMGLK